jgi:lyso-ornithine lipid O-acyltransferase
VKRESKLSRSATLEAMSEVLDKGFAVLVYPEGTTHLLPTTMVFRTGAFNMAVKKGYSIVPMAIDYADLGDAWVGDDTFLPHFFRTFGKKRTNVKIRYGQPMTSVNVDELVNETKAWIDKNMLDIRQAFELEKTSQLVSTFAK